MDNKYDVLFQPIKIGNMILKNRICMAPMDWDTDGLVTDQYIDYFERRAVGGAGMITTGAVSISPISENEGFVQMYKPINLPGMSRLAERVHAGGSKLCVEISAGSGRNHLNPFIGVCYAPSELPVFALDGVMSKEMTIEQIQQLLDDARISIRNIKLSGADCVNIHGHTGYLIDQFISSGWNLRTDEYGGSVHNRMRIVRELVDIIREECGKDFPIIFRVTLDHLIPGIRQEGETIEILKELEAMGIDALDVDTACYEMMDQIFPPYYTGDAHTLFVTDIVRQAGVKLPILNAGNHTPDTAADAVRDGKMDIAVLGRPLIADPDLPNKLLENKPEEVRPCIKCNMGCLQRSIQNGAITCAVNAEAGHEERAAAMKPCKKQNVVVIGGGPAGLEAARYAAVRGADVTLFEKSSILGGTARAIASPDWKYRFHQLFDWYTLQLKNLGVNVVLNTVPAADDEALVKADRIFVATGSVPVVPPIEGIDRENVVNVLDVHKNESLVKGDTVVVCGGGMSGCELALELAQQGKKVTVLDAMPMLAKDCVMINLMNLMREMYMNGINMMPNTKVIKFTEDGVLVETEEGEKLLPSDTAVHAFGIKSVNEFGFELMKKYPGRVLIIGDANKVNCIYDAVHSGYQAASSLV